MRAVYEDTCVNDDHLFVSQFVADPVMSLLLLLCALLQPSARGCCSSRPRRWMAATWSRRSRGWRQRSTALCASGGWSRRRQRTRSWRPCRAASAYPSPCSPRSPNSSSRGAVAASATAAGLARALYRHQLYQHVAICRRRSAPQSDCLNARNLLALSCLL